MNRATCICLCLSVIFSCICHAGQGGMSELTGVFHNAVGKGPNYIKIDGRGFISSIIVDGKRLKEITEGTRIWAKGKIETSLYGSADEGQQNEQQAPTQWFIVFHVEEWRKIAGPFKRPASGIAGMERQLPIAVSTEVEPRIVKSGEIIPLAITVSNGLSSAIDFLFFSLMPNDWNGETCNVSLVDIYRNGKTGNLYFARPEIKIPMTISGMGRKEIKPGDKLVIRTDARKWKVRDGWLPGKYKVTVRIDNLTVDKYSALSVLSDPIEFEIQ